MNENMPRSGDAGRVLSDAKDTIKEKAADLASNAKQQLGEQYEQRVHGVLGEVGHLATALRRVGQQLRDEQGATIAATVTDRVATRLDSVSSAIGNKNLDEVIGEVENFARRSPAAFLGVAAGIGFIASRFLKSSAPRRPYAFDSVSDFDRTYPDFGTGDV